jgi:hypothetical protein
MFLIADRTLVSAAYSLEGVQHSDVEVGTATDCSDGSGASVATCIHLRHSYREDMKHKTISN